MACERQQEWTIDVQVDGQPEAADAVIVFCLSIENGIINGEVADLTTGEPVQLSRVNGSSLPLTQFGPDDTPTVMTLVFTWNGSTVVLFGTTFRKDGINTFRGRFAKFPTLAVNETPTPGDGTAAMEGPGDTGTGTGTQT